MWAIEWSPAPPADAVVWCRLCGTVQLGRALPEVLRPDLGGLDRVRVFVCAACGDGWYWGDVGRLVLCPDHRVWMRAAALAGSSYTTFERPDVFCAECSGLGAAVQRHALKAARRRGRLAS